MVDDTHVVLFKYLNTFDVQQSMTLKTNSTSDKYKEHHVNFNKIID